MRIVLVYLLLASSYQAIAQNPNFPLPQQFDPEVEELIAKAMQQMEMEDYEGANSTFRNALATKKVLPTSMSYFFAKTLFVIHQNQNAKNFIEKYIELAGKGGDYYEEAVSLRNLIDKEFSDIKACELCNLSGYRYSTCDNCDGIGHTVELCYNCYGNSPIMCKKCIGRGVLITTTAFGERIYSSCDTCESKGYVDCPICEGKKEIAGRCTICLGTGKRVSKQICDHQIE